MKIFRIFSLLLLVAALSINAYAQKNAGQTLNGAWKKTSKNGLTEILLFQDGFFSSTSYSYEDMNKPFLLTMGGSYSWDGKSVKLRYEFHTGDSTMVGKEETFQALRKKNGLQVTAPGMQATKWVLLDAGVSTPLTGAYLISGRKNDKGEITKRNTDVPRKTMKILTGNRFQWIAYNTETGQFFGTGGGAYKAENGKYTESIEFFSRDPKRVGAKLEFDFKVEGQDWHHSGLSSSGQPLFEVWSKRTMP